MRISPFWSSMSCKEKETPLRFPPSRGPDVAYKDRVVFGPHVTSIDRSSSYALMIRHETVADQSLCQVAWEFHHARASMTLLRLRSSRESGH